MDALKNWTPADQIGFSAAIALGARAFFASFAGEQTKIKKPNDIYFRDRKAGGILIENTVRGMEWTCGGEDGNGGVGGGLLGEFNGACAIGK